MNRLRSFLFLLLILTVGCGSTGEGSGLLLGAKAPAFSPPPGPAAVVTVTELADDSPSFAGQYVQVTGQFRPSTVFVCDGLPRHSPAGWMLSEGTAAINAGGYDDLIRTLLPERMTVTVTGRWQQWEGPVGCGKTAPIQAIWYLAVHEIIAPQPLVRVTLTPPGGATATAVAIAPLPTSTRQASPTPTRTPTRQLPAETPASPPEPDDAYPGPAASTPTPAGTLTATGAVTTTATTAVSRGGTSQPTATPAPTDATATATTQTTPQATATETSDTIVERGSLSFDERLGDPLFFSAIALEQDELATAEGHRWEIEARAGDAITISAAAQFERDIVLQLRDSAGNILVTQNSRGPGDVEVIRDYAVPADGSYAAVVREATGSGGYYALLYLNSEFENYYEYVIAGVLPRNGSSTATMEEKTDHLWLFVASGGSTISITVAPSDSTDPILNLLNPKGELILEYVNDRGPGQSEIILNLQLDDSGLYVLHIGEDQYATSSYRVTVSGN